MRLVWIAVWLSAAAVCMGCVPFSLPLYKGTAAEVTVDGTRFMVRYTDTRAEASRMSADASPQLMVILSRALRGIEQVSGCKVRPGTLYGDWNLVEAYLSCPGKPDGMLQPVQSHSPPL